MTRASPLGPILSFFPLTWSFDPENKEFGLQSLCALLLSSFKGCFRNDLKALFPVPVTVLLHTVVHS